MKRIVIYLLLLFCGLQTAVAQGTVKGKVLDKETNEPLGFVNVVVSHRGDTKMVKGAITDDSGSFVIDGLALGQYSLNVSFVGYKSLKRDFALTQAKPSHQFSVLYLGEDAHQIQEVTVTGQRSAVKLEVDRKSFDVSQDISNAGGSASDVLENIPSVEVDQDGNISLRGNTSVEVWINGKQSGLTSDNRAQILQQLPSESIERIEVIDNPSAKFSAEGSAGIINIVLKKDRKAGYYGSLQTGGDTRGGGNVSGNINYNSSRFDAYANVGLRHRQSEGMSMSRQEYYETNQFQRYDGRSKNMGNNLFTRAGITWHATKKDDLTLSGMAMTGKRKDRNRVPYLYGSLDNNEVTSQMYRLTEGGGDMNMRHAELNYRHEFSQKHFLDFVVSYDRWRSNDENVYHDSTTYYYWPKEAEQAPQTTYSYQYRPMFIRNRTWEVKLDYENALSEKVKLQAGYNGRFSRENTPQESWTAENWEGTNTVEDQSFFNRFIYENHIHALYATMSGSFGPFGLMGGLRGEYWKVDTESYDWQQEHDPAKREEPFKKDYFELFPSLFLSYQLTPSQQLQLNYTRRLRRPWGGELNSFRNTRDASMVEFGNPQLTPEFSNSFSLNYLKTWTQHSLLLSAYYRPTSDVIQRIKYQSTEDGLMYQTNRNVAKSLSSGVEMVLKNKLWRRLDLTTTANAYYYKLDGFSYDIEGQTVTGESNHNFTWNARMQASLILPYDLTFQATGNYRARQVITQGYRKATCFVDLGLKKNFFNKQLTVALNCRDLLNSRGWETVTHGDTFWRHQKNRRNGRRVNLTVTWSFGNSKAKRPRQERPGDDDGQEGQGSGYDEPME